MKKTMKGLMSAVALIVMVLAMSVMVSAAEETVTVSTKYYGNEGEVTKNYSYTNETKLSNTECGIVIPLKVSEPGAIKLSINYTQLQRDINAYVYTDEACTNRLNIVGSANSGTTNKEGYVPVSNAGTYYLKFYSYSSTTSVFTNSFTVSVSQYTYSDKTIKSGETINYYRNNGSDQLYFKYKAEKTGTVTVTHPYSYGSYITLMSSKKKALTNAEWVSSTSNYKQTFAVKKGTTYYIMVKTNGTSGGNLQSISVKNAAVKEKSGSSKKKAVTIKSGKKSKGTIIAGSKTADWYKFSNKKKKKVTLTFNAEGAGNLVVTAYTKGGKKIGSYTNTGGTKTLSLTYSTTYGKVNKGTYYLKISRANAKSNGSYTIKWK